MTHTTEPESSAPGSRDEYAALLEQFGRGWEKGDTDHMVGVFADNAAFQPDPFDTPLQGREAIGEYWSDIPKDQAEITFKNGEIFVAGPWFAVEFRCRFRRRRTGQWMDVRGAIFCETDGGKISEMRMYWHRAAK